MTILSQINEHGDYNELDIIKYKNLINHDPYSIVNIYYNILYNKIEQKTDWNNVYGNEDCDFTKLNLSRWITFPSHNSGWKYVYEQIKDLHDDNGIIVDDFIERTFSWSLAPLKTKKFTISNLDNNTITEYEIPYEDARKYGKQMCFKLTEYLYLDNNDLYINITSKEFYNLPMYYKKPTVYRTPWIGFWHNPPESRVYLSKFSDQNQYTHCPDYICQRESFRESLKTCKGIFVFSESMKKWIENKFSSMDINIQINVLFHPIDFPKNIFSFEKFINNKDKKLVQIGSWLRNLNLIFEIDSEYKKLWISRDRDALIRFSNTNTLLNSKINKILSIYESNKEYYLDKNVYLINLDKINYEEIMTENIIITEIIGSSCNNGIIECIASATPILVNKTDSVIEYLGIEYPFYYHSRKELLAKSKDYYLIKKTHEYLLNLNTRKLITGTSFRENLLNSNIFNNINSQIETEKLDFVITWVNSSDEKWKKSFSKDYQDSKLFPCDSMTVNRYRSQINELKYSLRSIQASCRDLINRIFIVIHDDQTMPEWLIENDKLIVIRHSTIMEGNISYNSLAIESYLGNIPDISENFVYLNDDIWLLGNWKITDFINNKKLVFYTEDNEKGRIIKNDHGSHQYAWNNIHKLLNKLYPETINNFRPVLSHAPYILSKTSFNEHYNLPEIIETKKSKFRNYTDVGVACGFQQYSNYYKNKAIQKKLKEININVKQLLNTYGSIDNNARVLTLQDDFIDELNTEDKNKVFMILDCLFPIPSMFERKY